MPGHTDIADRLELFFGKASDAVVYVYARLIGPETAAGLQLTGTLVGPTCLYADTLPARFPFVDRGPGESLLAETIVPEPCFWSPEMPHLYRADIELVRGDEVLASARREFGIRSLGADGRKLFYHGTRWVLRAVGSDEVPPTDPTAWRECDAAMWVKDPDDQLCDAASRVGVLLVAELAAPCEEDVRRLARWPAVGVVVVPAGLTSFSADRGHNLLLAERFAAGQPVAPQPWAQLALVEVDAPNEFAARTGDCRVAVVAMRPAGKLANVGAGRAACDLLQRDLAGLGEWAGYIV